MKKILKMIDRTVSKKNTPIGMFNSNMLSRLPKFFIYLLIGITLFTYSPVFGFFIENPASFVVTGNVFSFSSEFYAVGNYVFKVAWQQREQNLSGELGYTTDSSFSSGIINYKLSNIKNSYGINIKANVFPIDNFSLSLDAGGRIIFDPKLLFEFGVSNITLINLGTLANPLPIFYGKVDFVYEKNFNIFAGFGYYEGDKLKFTFGLGIFGFSPLNVLSLSYNPVYKFLPGEVSGYGLIEGNLFFKLDNFDFKFFVFYNATELLDDDTLLKNQYGVKLSVGVNF